MNPALIRTMIAESAIAIAACVGGYLLLVEPGERRLHETRARIADLQAQSNAPAMSPEQCRKALKQGEQMRALVGARGRIAIDESAMFETVMNLTERHGVRVDQLQPAGNRASRPADPSAGPPEIRRTYALLVWSEFGALASFLDELQHDVGFTRVRSVKISVDNTPGSSAVIATIESEHIALSALEPVKAANAEARP